MGILMSKSKSLRISKRPTPWLNEVPPGNYTIKELQNITGKHTCTIKQRLKILELPKKYIELNGYPTAVYEWRGSEKYEQQNNKDQL